MLKLEKPAEADGARAVEGDGYDQASRDSKVDRDDESETAPTLTPEEEDSAAAGDVEAGGASPGGGASPVSPNIDSSGI